MDDELHKIGEPVTEQRPDHFELVLDTHIQFVNPKDYGVSGVIGINPSDYFVTSGDAVEKARTLYRDLKAHSVSALVISNTAYTKLIKASVEKAYRLLQMLILARGPDIFLETEWINHRLHCIPKNPRR